jgi:hypothetical protein
MSARKLAYLFVFVAALVVAGQSSQATIIWGNCADAARLSGPCPDSYDYEVCGVDRDLNECNCEHHGYTWVNGECE